MQKSMIKLMDKLKPLTDEQRIEYLEQLAGKKLDRPFVFIGGQGGGQKYKLFYDVLMVEHSQRKPCYYFTLVNDAILCNPLLKMGHKRIEEFLL